MHIPVFMASHIFSLTSLVKPENNDQTPLSQKSNKIQKYPEE